MRRSFRRLVTGAAGFLGLADLRDRRRVSAVMDARLLRNDPTGARVFQVVGIPRSGTTILSVALNAHPDVVCLIEPFLSYLKSGSLNCPDSEGNTDMRRDRPHEVIAELRRRPNLKWVGFKETFRLAHHRLFPNAGFIRANTREGVVDATIAIIRDPRDVWVSTLTRYEWSKKLPLDRNFTDSWNAFVEWTLEDKVHRVRYEDLVDDPMEVMEGIAKHLGIEPRKSMMKPPAVRGMGDDRGEEGGELFTTSVGRYRRELNPGPRAFIEAHCASGMREFGYSPGKTVGFVR